MSKNMKMSGQRPGPGPGPGHGPGRNTGPVQKPKASKETIKRLLKYIAKDKMMLIIVFFCVIFSSATAILGSYLLRPIVNNLATDLSAVSALVKDSADYKACLATGIANLIKGLLVMAGVYLLSVVLTYTQARIMIGVSQRALYSLRKDLYNKIQILPIRFFDERTTGEVMSRFTNDVDAIGEMLNNTITQLISGAITIIGTVIIMFYTNWLLAIITILFVPLMLKAGGTIAGKSRKFYSAQQAAIGALNGYIEETVTGQKVVKVFCHEDKVTEEFSELNDNLRNKQIKAQFFGGIMGPVMGNLGQINYAVIGGIGAILCIVKKVIAIGPLKIVLGGFDIGGVTVFVNYSRQFSRPINEVAMQINTIFSALAGAERVFQVMDMEPEEADRPDAVNMDDIEVKGKVVFENVTFGYNPDKIVLKDLSLYAKPGQKIAFVGSTGAGKTTITNLLN